MTSTTSFSDLRCPGPTGCPAGPNRGILCFPIRHSSLGCLTSVLTPVTPVEIHEGHSGFSWNNLGKYGEYIWTYVKHHPKLRDVLWFSVAIFDACWKKWYVLLDVDEYSGHFDQDPTQRHRHRLVTTCYDLPKSILSGEKKQHGELSVLFVGQKILGWWILWNHVPHQTPETIMSQGIKHHEIPTLTVSIFPMVIVPWSGCFITINLVDTCWLYASCLEIASLIQAQFTLW